MEPEGSVCLEPEMRCLRNFPRRADTDTSPSAPTSPGYGSGETHTHRDEHTQVFTVLES